MSSYVLNDEKMFADIADGIAIVINSETGIYYGMNAFATIVFENIQNDVSTESILKSIKTLDGVNDNIEENFKMFIKVMQEKEIIVEGGQGEGVVDINFEIAKGDNFALILKEYNDAQELLLADPIHEVKQEIGWTPEKISLNLDKEDVARRESKIN